MAKKKKPLIKLRCKECQRTNYFTKKSRLFEAAGGKLELKKFCRFCRKHTIHKEMKK